MKQLTLAEKLDILGGCVDNKVPVVILYKSKDGDKARAVRIDKIDVNQKNAWYCSGDDSLSGQYRSFTLDNIECLHPLSFGPLVNITITFPEDVAQRVPVESDAYQWP